MQPLSLGPISNLFSGKRCEGFGKGAHIRSLWAALPYQLGILAYEFTMQKLFSIGDGSLFPGSPSYPAKRHMIIRIRGAIARIINNFDKELEDLLQRLGNGQPMI